MHELLLLLLLLLNPASCVQVEPQRNVATIRLPCPGLPAICALQHPGCSSSNGFGGTGGTSSGMSDLAALPEEEPEEVRQHSALLVCAPWSFSSSCFRHTLSVCCLGFSLE
jgi:hypothetical protein